MTYAFSTEKATVMLNRRRIYILPTAAGLLFALALLLMLLGAINYNLALGHALVFLLAGLGSISMIHTHRNLSGLSITGGRAEPVFAGETAHFPLHLAQDRPEARWALELNAQDQVPIHCDLPAGGLLRIALPVTSSRRGRLSLPPCRIASRYPLGFFRAWSTLRLASDCLVYPSPLLLPLPETSAAPAGVTRQGPSGQEDFSGLRRRQASDSPRHVAWKAAARNGPDSPLLVKQFSGGAQAELWLDWQLLPAHMDREMRLSALTGWVLAADAKGERYGLSLPEGKIPPGEGNAHRQRCLERLALAPT